MTPPEDTFTNTVEDAAAYERYRAANDPNTYDEDDDADYYDDDYDEYSGADYDGPCCSDFCCPCGG